MISVVIPTMWKFAPFPDFLASIVTNPVVSDIIIINNCRQDTPTHAVWQNSKITMMDYGRNLFVNPSWNLGVMYTQSNIVCIANDDVIYDPRIFQKINNQLQLEHGCYGICNVCPTSGDVYFEQHIDQPILGFGQLKFIHRKNWIDIPAHLNIMYGDNFVFDMQKKYKRSNFLIKNLLHYTPGGQTSQLIRTPSQESDRYLSICDLWNIPHYYPCPRIS